MQTKNLIALTLIGIIILAFGLRIYKIDKIPPSISWDEATAGYNAWSVANYGRDEYGKIFPLVFKSFGDDKRPIHIYITAIFVRLIGLSEFSIRLPVAIVSSLTVVLVFLLGRELFQSSLMGLFAALFLAVSPYSIQFGRIVYEANYALFFFMLALWLFLVGLRQKNYLLSLSFVSLGISLFSYHSSLVVVPLMLGLLLLFYFKDLWKIKGPFILGIISILLFAIVMFRTPAILGGARINQNNIAAEKIEQTAIYKQTKNEFLARVEYTISQYLSHFSFKYLFVSGDSNSRHSTQKVGEFYKIDLIFLILGAIGLVLSKNRKALLLLGWAAFAPLPASLVQGAPHAVRASFMLGSFQLIAAYGLYILLRLIKNQTLKIVFTGLVIVILGYSVYGYLSYYFGDYSKQSAIEWQYGMKQVVQYVAEHPEYQQVYMTEERHQPYIFFLFYLKEPLPDYLNTVIYNRSESKDYNLISFFDKYYFGNWNKIDSFPTPGVLYILTINEYGGLRHRLEFDVKKIIKYPDGSDAFYLVSAK